MQVISLLDRTGRLAGAVRGEGMEPIDGPAAEGVAVDALHRLLDLPTAPAPGDTAEVWSVIWAQALLGHASPRSLRWPAAAALHPASQFAGDPQQVEADLAASTRRLLEFAGWAWLRRLAIRTGSLAPTGLTPTRTARLDDGAFARCLLWSMPALDGLLERCDAELTPGVARRVRAVAAGSG